jgi:hypothetical protein
MHREAEGDKSVTALSLLLERGEQQPQRVNQEMALTAAELLAAIVAADAAHTGRPG